MKIICPECRVGGPDISTMVGGQEVPECNNCGRKGSRWETEESLEETLLEFME